jgi:hypothetical protein
MMPPPSSTPKPAETKNIPRASFSVSRVASTRRLSARRRPLRKHSASGLPPEQPGDDGSWSLRFAKVVCFSELSSAAQTHASVRVNLPTKVGRYGKAVSAELLCAGLVGQLSSRKHECRKVASPVAIELVADFARAKVDRDR